MDGRNSTQGMKECSQFLELVTKASEIRLQDSKQVVEPDSQAVQISHGISTQNREQAVRGRLLRGPPCL